MAATPKARLYKIVTPPKEGGGINVEVGKSFTYGGGTEGMHSSVKAINRLGLTTNSIALMVAKMNATFAENMKIQMDQQQALADQREEGVQKLVDQRKAEAEDLKQKEDLEQDLAGEDQQEAVPKEKKGIGYKAGAIVGAVSNAFGFFEGIAKFIGRIFKTLVTVAFLKWMGNPENLKKVEKVVSAISNIGKWLLKIAGFLVNMGLDGLTDFLENPLSFKGIFGIVKFLTAAAIFFAPAKMAMLGMKGVMALFKGGKLFKLIGGMVKGLVGVFKGVLGFIMARPRAALMVGAGVLAAWGLKTLFGGKKDEEDEEGKKKKADTATVDEEIELEEKMDRLTDKFGTDALDMPEYIKHQIREEELNGGNKDVIDALKQKLERAEGKDKKGKVKPKKIAKGGLNLFGNKEKPKNTQEKTEKTKKKKNVKPIEKDFKMGRKTYDLSQPFGGLSDDEWTNELDGRQRGILSRNMRAYQNQKQMAKGGWISGPQSGYPVSLDGGRSTSFIGHGTEYVAQKKTGGAFVVPYDTPATRGNQGLTGRRTKEATNKGFKIPGFSAGGLIQGAAEGGPMADTGNMTMDELVEAAGPSLLAFMKQHNELLDSDPEFYNQSTRLYMDRDGKMLNFGKTIANMSEWAFNEGNQQIIDNESIDPEVKKLLLKKMDWVRRQTLDNPNFKSDIAFNLNKDIPGTAANRLYEKAKNSPGNIAIKAGIPPEEVARLWNRRGLSSGGHINLVNLSAGGMVPKEMAAGGDYINIQAMAEGGEYDEGGDDASVSIHKGDLPPISMGKQADAGPAAPIVIDNNYEPPANDYFQTRYGLMAEGNTAPVEMF